jgi:hypothetical protein
VTLNTHLQYRFYRKCERKWRARLLTEGINASAATFVRLAPEAQPRLYEHFSHWDIGLLLLTGSRLCYVGEQTRFELRRDEVADVRRGIALPRAFQSDACVYVSWRNAETGQDGSFHLAPPTSNPFLRSHAALDTIEKAIARWRAVHAANETLPWPDLPKPGVGVVTSISFRQAASASVIARAIHINGAIAAAGCVLAGLPLFGRGAWYVILLVAGSMVTEWIAYSRCDDKARPPHPQVSPEASSCQPPPS